MTPMLHMSQAGLYCSEVPLPISRISGATYCGEPHMVDSTSLGARFLDNPKSAILIGASWSWLSSRMFSSFRSRCTIPAIASLAQVIGCVCNTLDNHSSIDGGRYLCGAGMPHRQ